MIVYNDVDCTAVRELERLDHVFYLTGSRYFEEPNPHDWDFFTIHSKETLNDLVSLGYRVLPMFTYHDILTCEVLSKVMNDIKVDIQLVSDPIRKWRVQEYLKRNRIPIPKDKSERTDFWNLCLDLAGLDMVYEVNE